MNTNRWTLLWIALGIAAIIGLRYVGRLNAPPEAVAWLLDPDQASAAARPSGKPVLAYFTATWCGPCRQLQSSTFADPAVAAAIDAAAVPLKVDIDLHPGLAQRYQITGVPTVLLLDADGQPISDLGDAIWQSDTMIAAMARVSPGASASTGLVPGTPAPAAPAAP